MNSLTAKRHPFRIIVITVLAGVLLLAGCARETRRPGRRNILRIGTTRDGLKSASIPGDVHLAAFAQISNPPLMTMNSQGDVEGLLVESVDVDDTLQTWTFTLRPGLSWNDGVRVSAEDVLFSIELFAKHVPYARWMRNLITRGHVERDRVFVLHLSRPYARLDFDFTTYNTLPKHVWEHIKDPMRHTNTGENVGCGPFTITKIDLDAGLIVFRKNPYWEPLPELDGIELHLYNTVDVLALALEKGQVDTYYRYASTYPYFNLPRLRATGQFAFLEEPHVGFPFLGFNIRKNPMSDPRFRKALSFAVDYQEILNLIFLGFGETPNTGFVPPSMPGFIPTPSLIQDIQKAHDILNEAGYIDRDGDGIREDRSGENMKLLLLTSSPFLRLAELVQGYIQKLGIGVERKVVDTNTWTALKDRYAYDLLISRTTPWGMFMHAGWGTGYFDSRRSGEGVLHTVDDPEFLNLCDRILATLDPEEQTTAARSVQEYYARHLPGLPLCWNRIVIPFQKRFTGWTLNPLYGIYNIRNFTHLEVGPDEPPVRGP